MDSATRSNTHSATLDQVNPGQRCLVLEIDQDAAEIRSRLYDLGIIPGSALEVLRVAPLGDPLQVKVGVSYVSIRRQEASSIKVEIQ